MNELIGYFFVGALLLATLGLVVAARRFLPERWWIGAAVSGLIGPMVIIGVYALLLRAQEWAWLA